MALAFIGTTSMAATAAVFRVSANETANECGASYTSCRASGISFECGGQQWSAPGCSTTCKDSQASCSDAYQSPNYCNPVIARCGCH